MQSGDLVIKVIVPIAPALFGGVIVALVNYYLNNKNTIMAGVERTKAETDKLRAATRMLERNIKHEIVGVETKQAELAKFIEGIFLLFSAGLVRAQSASLRVRGASFAMTFLGLDSCRQWAWPENGCWRSRILYCSRADLSAKIASNLGRAKATLA